MLVIQMTKVINIPNAFPWERNLDIPGGIVEGRQTESDPLNKLLGNFPWRNEFVLSAEKSTS